jgi:hypothetical protein
VESNVILVRDEKWQSSQSILQDYVHVFECHLPKERPIKVVRDPISLGIDPLKELFTEFCGVGNNDRGGKQYSIGEI